MKQEEFKHYLEEMRLNIRLQDRVKLRLLLPHFKSLTESQQQDVIAEFSKTNAPTAVFLCTSIAAEMGKEESTVIEQLKNGIINELLRDPSVINDLLRDPGIGSKQLLIDVIGELQLESAVEALIGILHETSDNDEIFSLLTALGDIAVPEAVGAVTDHLYCQDHDIILAAIKALQKIATPTSVQRLVERMGTDKELDLVIVDSLAGIQNTVALEKLNSCLSSHHAFIRNRAKTKLIEIGDKAVPLLIDNLLYDDTELVIHSLNILSEIGDDSSVTAIRKLLFSEPKNANIRFAAYEALGRLPLHKGAYVLAAGMSDPVANVRTAAAKAIDRNYSPILATGIRNLMTSHDTNIQQFIEMILESESDNIFIDLLADKYFCKYSLAYLRNKAHKEIRSHFAALLHKKGFTKEALELTKEKSAPRKKEKTFRIVAVDDSRMVLKIYRSTLHRLGYESELFEFPGSAFNHCCENKPDLLVTDLNMPDMTGIELTKRLRSVFFEKELPIVMVTTQHEIQDHHEAYQAGVNVIVNKPFNDATLQDAIEKAMKLVGKAD